MKNTLRIGVVAATAALALAACSSAPKDDVTPTGTSDQANTATPTESVDYKACMVSDAGGFDDKSFNQTSYEGLQQAVADLGLEVATAESRDENDYVPNLEALVSGDCNLIITVGFKLSADTVTSALANPTINYAIIDDLADNDFDGTTDAPNIKPITFDTDEAAFLAGYASAATTKTGTVATFGGIQIPSVTIFMDGFLHGVQYYNEQNGTNVNVLGWDGTNGSFTGDFDDQTKGQSMAQGFIDNGADIIMPVAGPVGLGAASVAQSTGNVWIVGVDSDWVQTAPEYASIILTSVMKKMDVAVYDLVTSSAAGAGFDATAYLGTLANGGVGLADFYDAPVSAELKAQLDEIKNAIIAGDITA